MFNDERWVCASLKPCCSFEQSNILLYYDSGASDAGFKPASSPVDDTSHSIFWYSRISAFEKMVLCQLSAYLSMQATRADTVPKFECSR